MISARDLALAHADRAHHRRGRRGIRAGRGRPFPGSAVRGAAGGRAEVRTAATAGAVDGHARRHEIRPDLPADCDAARGSSVRGDGGRPGDGRGLPLPQRHHSLPRRIATGHGLDTWRRIQRRQWLDPALRRHAVRTRRRRVRVNQLSVARPRVPVPRRALRGGERHRQPRHPRSGRRASVGARQHRSVRRRPEQRDDLR